MRVYVGGLCLPTLAAQGWGSLPGRIKVGGAPPISCWGGVVLEAGLGMCFARSENKDLGHRAPAAGLTKLVIRDGRGFVYRLGQPDLEVRLWISA